MAKSTNKRPNENSDENDEKEILNVIKNFDKIPLTDKLIKDSNTYLRYMYTELSSAIEEEFSNCIKKFHSYDYKIVQSTQNSKEFPVDLFIDTVYTTLNFLSDRYYYIFRELNIAPEKIEVTFEGKKNFKTVDIKKNKFGINISTIFAFSIFCHADILLENDKMYLLNPDTLTDDENSSEYYNQEDIQYISPEEISHISTPQDFIIHSVIIEFVSLLQNILLQKDSAGIIESTILDEIQDLLSLILSEYYDYLFSCGMYNR